VLPPPVAAVPTRAPLDPPPPPTLAAPARQTATPALAPTVSARVVVGNTGGRGAVLRAEPGTGQQVGALHDEQPLDVIGRTTLGDAEWLHVRTMEGLEGWVSGRVVLPSGSASH
jgi:hypothetical protein